MLVPPDCQELGGRLDRDAGHTCVKDATPQQGYTAPLLGLGNTFGGLRSTHPKGGKAVLSTTGRTGSQTIRQ